MNTTEMNTLTIQETNEILTAEHAASVFRAEFWWSIVPSGDNNPHSYASSGDSSGFWALVRATQELGMPLGFTKTVNHLGATVSAPHNDPEQVLRMLIKPQTKASLPNKEVSAIRAKYLGVSADAYHEQQMALYQMEVAADEGRINQVVQKIMGQGAYGTDNGTEMQVPVHDADGEIIDYETIYMEGGEWNIPIDRIIEVGERNLKALATNNRVNDKLFGAEAIIWNGEIERLHRIIQPFDSSEQAGNSSAEIDNALLSGDGLRAGMNSGK